MATKKAATAKTNTKEEVKKEVSEKVQVEVLKGFGDKFGSDKVKDGSVFSVSKWIAADLVKRKFVKIK